MHGIMEHGQEEVKFYQMIMVNLLYIEQDLKFMLKAE